MDLISIMHFYLYFPFAIVATVYCNDHVLNKGCGEVAILVEQTQSVQSKHLCISLHRCEEGEQAKHAAIEGYP
jgi:hypothetical protein